MKVKFWGVRGSLACPGKDTIKYGGNTSCIQIDTGLDYQIIIDCGTGIRELGDFLALQPKPVEAYIFLTHVHWDHICGLPFFKPIYLKGCKIHVFSPHIENESIVKNVASQMSFPNFPVEYKDLPCEIDFNELNPGEMTLPEDVKVCFKHINHQIPTFGYRISYQDKSVATCFDHEPYTNILNNKQQDYNQDECVKLTQQLASFYYNADLLIHDAQFTTEEYKNSFYNWGHSSYEVAVKNAILAKVKRLSFFHHDLTRTDKMLDKLDKIYSKQAKKHGIDAHPAAEGSEIIL